MLIILICILAKGINNTKVFSSLVRAYTKSTTKVTAPFAVFFSVFFLFFLRFFYFEQVVYETCFNDKRQLQCQQQQ